MISRRLPIGIQSFEDIRENEYVYIDKTDQIYNLANTGKVYFLSRPRRFGKSLLISTMEAYFSGKKNLFTGLKIDSLEKKWDEYPVFRFDFSGKEYKNRQDLEQKLFSDLKEIERKYSLKINEKSPELIFASFIKQAFFETGKKVVVLVDEYDKAILETLENDQVNDECRSLLRGFWGVLKNCDDCLKFVFITGVTKFSKVSIFSDLNQANDITFSPYGETLCGITQEELEKCFSHEIKELADVNGISNHECLNLLKQKYDGYHFSQNLIDIYNPYSILKTLSDKFFGTYWFETGTPDFLIKLFENTNYEIYNFTDGIEYSISTLMNKSDADFDIVQLLYQTGYITIKSFNREFNSFVLAYPNTEVEYSFLSILLPSFLTQKQSTSDFWIREFFRDLKNNNVDSFMTRLKSIIASVPYATEKRPSEHDFQITIYLVFTLLGQFTQAECYTNKGRIDCLVKTANSIFLFEFKVDATVDSALLQIDKNKYEEQFKSSGKQIIKIGASFDSSTRTLSEWKAEWGE